MELSCSIYSSRIIQHLLDLSTNFSLKKSILTFVIDNIITLALDCNGLHVVIKCIEEIYKNTYSNEQNDKLEMNNIYNIISKELKMLCFSKFGCCFIQKIIKISSNNYKNKIISIIMNYYFEEFIHNSYANYVLQEIISQKYLNINRDILNYVSKDIMNYSKSKATSNIIEKLLLEYTEPTMLLLKNIINKDKLLIRELVLDNFGNYGKSNKNKYVIAIIIVFTCLLSTSVDDAQFYNMLLEESSKYENEVLDLTYGPCFLKKLLEKHPQASVYFNIEKVESMMKEIHKKKIPISNFTNQINKENSFLSPEEKKKNKLLKLKKKRKKYLK